MKTIEEAAKMSPNGVDIQSEVGKIIAQYGNTEMGRYRMQIFTEKLSEISFKNGVEFAQRWIPVEEELPEVGDVVLVRTKIGKVLTCEMYIPMDYLGNVLGEKKWCGSYNFKQAVTHWRPVNLK